MRFIYQGGNMKKIIASLTCIICSLFVGLYASMSFDAQVGQNVLRTGNTVSRQMLHFSIANSDAPWYVGANLDRLNKADPKNILAVDGGMDFHFLRIGTGVAYVDKTSDSLSSHIQFYSTASLMLPFMMTISFKHISNANTVTKLGGPNHGENFLLLGYTFKL